MQVSRKNLSLARGGTEEEFRFEERIFLFSFVVEFYEIDLWKAIFDFKFEATRYSIYLIDSFLFVGADEEHLQPHAW